MLSRVCVTTLVLATTHSNSAFAATTVSGVTSAPTSSSAASENKAFQSVIGLGISYAPSQLYFREHFSEKPVFYGVSGSYIGRIGSFGFGLAGHFQESTASAAALLEYGSQYPEFEWFVSAGLGAATLWRYPDAVRGLGLHVEAKAGFLLSVVTPLALGLEIGGFVERFRIVPPPSERSTTIGAIPFASLVARLWL